ncbi:Flagellin N-methylase [Planctomycetes bacterium Pan216]|uniref:Flagellin N-methylase n=1 Tax=Kolteria novifilia TaxID=2527975 RepID=A0A518B6E5_9BACT|nr:Flagellin N-methylase [Planctomycetes bacterium Pan216]
MNDRDETPWYRDGLRFECTQCGACCTGEPGYVWVDEAEIAALARQLNQEVDEFEKAYVRPVGRRKSLRERDNGDCVFFDRRKGCVVYADRPIQCRTWPFWRSNIETRGTWQVTKKECPGSGHGPLFTLEEIEAQARLIQL